MRYYSTASNFEKVFFVIIFPGLFTLFACLIRFESSSSIHKRYHVITASEIHSCISVIGSEEVDFKS